MKFVLFVVASVLSFSAHAIVENSVSCVPGTPSSSQDQVHFTSASFKLHWVGNMMQGIYYGTLQLNGSSFANGSEVINVTAEPNFNNISVGGKAASSWNSIDTCTQVVQDTVGTTCVGKLNLRTTDGWTKSVAVICTKTP